MNKYQALQNTTDWIVNCSIEEFMGGFNNLLFSDTEQDSPNLGSIIDSFPDFEFLENQDSLCINIMTTDNFVFGAEVVSNKLENFLQHVDLSQCQIIEIDSIGCLAECC